MLPIGSILGLAIGSIFVPPIGSIFDVATGVGYPLLFLIVFLETGCGIPFAPGEIATVAAGIAAAEGELKLEWVIAVVAAAAIVGDNFGYMIGRLGGRRLLERPGLFFKQRQHVLAIADPFFDHHGPKAVFFGRWLPVLRVYASWLAGASKMRWGIFFFWNATGGVVWATTMALAGYYGGTAGKSIIEGMGKYGAIVVLLGAGSAFFLYHRQQRRGEEWLRTQSQTLRAIQVEGSGANLAGGSSRGAPAKPPQ